MNIFLNKASLYALALLSSLHRTIKRHDEKILAMQAFNELDNLIADNFNRRLDYVSIHQHLQKLFIFLWSFSVASNCTILVIYCSYPQDFFLYGFSTCIFTHVIQVEAFQFYIFSNGVQNRLNVISDEFTSLLTSLEMVAGKLSTVTKSMISLYETNQQFNRCFKCSLILNMMQFYSSILINLYWAGTLFLGKPYASITGNFKPTELISQTKNFINCRSCYIPFTVYVDTFVSCSSWSQIEKVTATNYLSCDITKLAIVWNGRIFDLSSSMQIFYWVVRGFRHQFQDFWKGEFMK